jgi:hypothetical protein
MHPFRSAIEARDVEAAVALMREDVVFRSPAVFILEAVVEVFQDFRYTREIGAADASDHALVFEARVGDKQLEGCDFLRHDEDGVISELTVMIRPLSAALALAEAMKAQLSSA